MLRDAIAPVPRSALTAAWQQPGQRERALAGLIADGLIEPLGDDTFVLPMEHLIRG